jgi:Ulp1 family protease
VLQKLTIWFPIRMTDVVEVFTVTDVVEVFTADDADEVGSPPMLVPAIKYKFTTEHCVEILRMDPKQRLRWTPLLTLEDVAIKTLMWSLENVELVRHFQVSVTPALLRFLQPRKWISDEIINLYGLMLERKNEQDNKQQKDHLLSNTVRYAGTHFITQLTKKGTAEYHYTNVSDMCRRIFKQNMPCKEYFDDINEVFIPVNVAASHWVLINVSPGTQYITYFDSIRTRRRSSRKHPAYVTLIQQWCADVTTTTPNDWTILDGSTMQQDNGYDCGVFVIRSMDFLANTTNSINYIAGLYRHSCVIFPHKTSDMLQYRYHIAADIVRGHLF